MATAKSTSKNICDETFAELEDIKDRIVALRTHLVRDYACEDNVLPVDTQHLSEFVDQIEWKLQIMSHSCTHDWKGSTEYEENIVSVGPAETSGEEFSPGYLGG